MGLTDEIIDTNAKKRNPDYRVVLGNDPFGEDEISPRKILVNRKNDIHTSAAETDEGDIVGNADPSRLSPPNLRGDRRMSSICHQGDERAKAGRPKRNTIIVSRPGQ